MKRILLLGAMVFATTIFAQTTAELKKEIDDIKTSIANIHTEIQSVKSENLYYKKNSGYKQTHCTGNGKWFGVYHYQYYWK